MLKDRLIKLRKARKLSQYELAEKLGFSRGKLANYEQGSRQPDYDTLIQIADFFDVSTDYLLKGEDYKNEDKHLRAAEENEKYRFSQVAARDGEITEEDLEVLERILERERGRKPGDRQPKGRW